MKITEINLVQKDSSLDKVSIEEINTLNGKKADKLIISGLTQKTFEYLITNFGSSFTHYEFYKCRMVSDFTLLEQLNQIKYVEIMFNQNSKTFWNLSRNPKIVTLKLLGCTGLTDYSFLSNCTSLKELEIGDPISGKNTITSFEPIGTLSNLEKLTANFSKVTDNKIEPLSKLKNIKELNIPINSFKMEQFAWLRAKLPKVNSEALEPYKKFEPIDFGTKSINTIVCGKRKPRLDSVKESAKLQKYIEEFEASLLHYINSPSAHEPK